MPLRLKLYTSFYFRSLEKIASLLPNFKEKQEETRRNLTGKTSSGMRDVYPF